MKNLMKLEEEYKMKLQNMNNQIAQSLFEELSAMATDLLAKNTLSVYQGPEAIKLYQNLRENMIRQLRDSESTITNLVGYPQEQAPTQQKPILPAQFAVQPAQAPPQYTFNPRTVGQVPQKELPTPIKANFEPRIQARRPNPPAVTYLPTRHQYTAQ
jgi:hypothetical protein